MAEGQELYAIIPPNDKGTITVYPSTMTEDGEYADDKSNPLCIGKPGEVLLLRCNLSEIYSNVLISVTDGGGAVFVRLLKGRSSDKRFAGVRFLNIRGNTR